ncbi:hypothetical protein PoMZ_08593, partial [Pyricularia oryzae]
SARLGRQDRLPTGCNSPPAAKLTNASTIPTTWHLRHTPIPLFSFLSFLVAQALPQASSKKKGILGQYEQPSRVLIANECGDPPSGEYQVCSPQFPVLTRGRNALSGLRMPPIGSALLDPDVFALREPWRICWTLTVGGELVRSMASLLIPTLNMNSYGNNGYSNGMNDSRMNSGMNGGMNGNMNGGMGGGMGGGMNNGMSNGMGGMGGNRNGYGGGNGGMNSGYGNGGGRDNYNNGGSYGSSNMNGGSHGHSSHGSYDNHDSRSSRPSHRRRSSSRSSRSSSRSSHSRKRRDSDKNSGSSGFFGFGGSSDDKKDKKEKTFKDKISDSIIDSAAKMAKDKW